jgi:transposase InsO family protein
MVGWLILFLRFAVAPFKGRRYLLLENPALRHQLLVLSRSVKRPRLEPLDRALWVWLSHSWKGWKTSLRICQPDTVIQWHRAGFCLFWRWKSRPRPTGRKAMAPEIIRLIRQMSHANPLWGAPRIHGELLKLGIVVAQRSVAKYMVPRARRPPSQNWKTFLRNHLGSIMSVDFFTVPTLTFQVLYVFIVLSHQRRRVLHFNIVESPSAGWTAQQLREAFPFTSPPKYLLRDRDGIYGLEFQRRAEALGLEQVRIAPRSPWQSPYVERLIGSVRRDCLDHVIVLNQAHLHRLLKSYFAYYHRSRTHLSLGKDAPEPRPMQGPQEGNIVAFPQVGGLHHRYERLAA